MTAFDDHYFLSLAAAYVRGTLGLSDDLPDEEAVLRGREAGIPLHKFKKTTELPRVRKALGILRGFAPSSLLDVGSGRGTFLYPLLDALDWLRVLSIDRLSHRVSALDAVRRGGVDRLCPLRMDVHQLALAEDAVDGVTILEVLEHLDRPQQAAEEVVRVAKRFVLASVPSKEDDNPEHIHLFAPDSLRTMFLRAGAKKVQIDGVPNHYLVIATV